MTELTEKEIIKKLSTACVKREYCTQDMQKKMRLWGVDTDTQASVLAYLTKNKYVDNARYARAFVFDKARYNKWGRKKIDYSLRLKGHYYALDADLLDQVEDYDYRETLLQILKTKRKQIKDTDEYKVRNKLIRFALGRGFTMDQTLKALKEMGQQVDDIFQVDSSRSPQAPLSPFKSVVITC